MGRRLIAPLALLLALVSASPALALDWHTVHTLTPVRGAADPQVAIDGQGKASVVVANTGGNDAFGTSLDLFVRALGVRSIFFQSATARGNLQPAIATNPSGAVGVAAVDRGRLRVTLYPAPGPKASPPIDGLGPAVANVDAAGFSVADPQIALTGDGTATVAWISPPWDAPPPAPTRVYAVEISPTGAVGPVQELAGPGTCSAVLDGNLRGDAVVLTHCGVPNQKRVHVKPADGTFGPPLPVPDFEFGPTDVTIDGSGNVIATETETRWFPKGPSEYYAYYAVRPAGGAFGERRAIPMSTSGFDFVAESQEDGRTVAAWTESGSYVYAYRAPNGDFTPAGAIPVAASVAPGFAGLVVAPTGPALVWWREYVNVGRDPQLQQVVAAVIDQDGPTEGVPVSVPGPIGTTFPASFAINADGHAVGAWEQRCEGGGYAVMAVVHDDFASESRQTPCQDTRPPKVIAVHKRALLRKRQLRVRIACDEVCRYTASARVLRRGSRTPLGRARSGPERRLAARRGGSLRLRLFKRQAARIGRAIARGQRVTLRLGVSVRDIYGNGHRWRIAVPVRR